MLNIEGYSKANLRMLAALERAMGRPLGRAQAGRWRDIDYEAAGERVDLRRLWKA